MSSDDEMSFPELGQNCSESKLQIAIGHLKKIAINSCLLHKHGACLFQGDKIFSFGVNKYYRNNTSPLYRLSVHAEIDALVKCNKFSKGMDVLIIRLGKNNKLKYSRPCNGCIEKLREKGIRKAYYSNSNGDIVYEFIEHMPKIHSCSSAISRLRGTN